MNQNDVCEIIGVRSSTRYLCRSDQVDEFALYVGRIGTGGFIFIDEHMHNAKRVIDHLERSELEELAVLIDKKLSEIV